MNGFHVFHHQPTLSYFSLTTYYKILSGNHFLFITDKTELLISITGLAIPTSFEKKKNTGSIHSLCHFITIVKLSVVGYLQTSEMFTDI